MGMKPIRIHKELYVLLLSRQVTAHKARKGYRR